MKKILVTLLLTALSIQAAIAIEIIKLDNTDELVKVELSIAGQSSASKHDVKLLYLEDGESNFSGTSNDSTYTINLGTAKGLNNQALYWNMRFSDNSGFQLKIIQGNKVVETLPGTGSLTDSAYFLIP